MFEKLSDNLNLLMTEVHISADELARRTGIPASTIKKIRNRYNPNPTLTTLIPLAQFFSLTLGQLVGDEPLPNNRMKGTYQVNEYYLKQIPIISWEEALSWPNISTQQNFISTEYEYSNNAFALIIEEEGWENLAKGTVLLIDPMIKVEHRDYVIVHKEGQTSPILKQVLHDEDKVFLKSVLNTFSIIPFSSTHKILGVVVEYKKHLKNTVSKGKEK